MNNHLSFPKNFIWGAATSSYQIEGAAAKDGRTESIWDHFAKIPGKIRNADNGDVACNHYHLWEKDVQLMKTLGLKAYRFSISWSRVLPEGEGKINPKGMDFYKQLVDKLLENNIEPFVTLYHWDLPMALQYAGGWLNRRIADWFTEYACVMYKALGDRVRFWSTLNEPNVFAMCGHLLGVHAPGVKDLATCKQVTHHQLLAHGDAVIAGRALLPKAQFGITIAIGMDYPATDTPEDHAAVEKAWLHGTRTTLDPIFRGSYPLHQDKSNSNTNPVILEGDLKRIAQPLDYLGINHYFSNWLTANDNDYSPKNDKDLPVTDIGWIVFPQGLKDMLTKVTEEYGKIPIYIMENGASYPDTVSEDSMVHDSLRVDYYHKYLNALHQAICQGVDIRGYFAWSLLDNFEWAEGYSSRFGIVYVDFKTQQRIIKDSGIFYSRVIRENGISE
ncbi:MAG TPA: GH1 family beta-glucosidase [Chitinispirillaceae bacterium]|nr:GH1 family beta-glucosidase [Chitinispirillaceae bacterium]